MGKGHGHGAGHSSPTGSSVAEDPFGPSTLHAAARWLPRLQSSSPEVLKDSLESLIRHAQEFLTHALPRIHEAMPSSLQEAAVKGRTLAEETWRFICIHFHRLKKLLILFLEESRTDGEILLSDVSQYRLPHCLADCEKMAYFVFQLGASRPSSLLTPSRDSRCRSSAWGPPPCSSASGASSLDWPHSWDGSAFTALFPSTAQPNPLPPSPPLAKPWCGGHLSAVRGTHLP